PADLCLALDDERVQPQLVAPERRRKSRRPGPDDDYVVHEQPPAVSTQLWALWVPAFCRSNTPRSSAATSFGSRREAAGRPGASMNLTAEVSSLPSVRQRPRPSGSSSFSRPTSPTRLTRS